MRSRVRSRLGEIRKSRGVGASDLARRVNVSRQTIYAIEAGTYVPNTEVALSLARELEVGIDELFWLDAASAKSPDSISGEVLSASPPKKGQPVRICRIGSNWVSVPVSAPVPADCALNTGIATKDTTAMQSKSRSKFLNPIDSLSFLEWQAGGRS